MVHFLYWSLRLDFRRDPFYVCRVSTFSKCIFLGSDTFSNWVVVEVIDFEVTYSCFAQWSFSKWSIYQVKNRERDLFTKWPFLRNDRFRKNKFYNLSNFRDDSFSKIVFFAKWSISKWLILQSDQFAEWLIFKMAYFSKWSISMWAIWEVIHFRNCFFCEVIDFEVTDFWNCLFPKWSISR